MKSEEKRIKPEEISLIQPVPLHYPEKLKSQIVLAPPIDLGGGRRRQMVLGYYPKLTPEEEKAIRALPGERFDAVEETPEGGFVFLLNGKEFAEVVLFKERPLSADTPNGLDGTKD
jgi:hypothetical protein